MSTIEPTIFRTIFSPEGSNPVKAPICLDPKPEPSTSCTFTPRETPKTPQQQELSRTVYSHVARLHVCIKAWKKNTDKSYKIGKDIYRLHLHQFEEDYFPPELQPLMESLMEILGDMGEIYEEVTELENRMSVLAKLQPNEDPVLTTWSVKMVAQNMTLLCKLLKRQYKILETVIENIAHNRNENAIEVYAISLAPSPVLSTEAAHLFYEAGLPLV